MRTPDILAGPLPTPPMQGPLSGHPQPTPPPHKCGDSASHLPIHLYTQYTEHIFGVYEQLSSVNLWNGAMR